MKKENKKERTFLSEIKREAHLCNKLNVVTQS